MIALTCFVDRGCLHHVICDLLLYNDVNVTHHDIVRLNEARGKGTHKEPGVFFTLCIDPAKIRESIEDVMPIYCRPSNSYCAILRRMWLRSR